MTKGYVGYIHQHDQRKSNQKRQTAQDVYKFDLKQKRRVHTIHAICQALNHLDKFCMNLTLSMKDLPSSPNSCKKTPLRVYRIVCDNLRFMGWEKHMNMWKCQTRFLMFCFSKLNMDVHVHTQTLYLFLCLGHV